MKYNDNGEYKDIYIKTFDTLPVGTEVDYDGETVPDGWTQVSDYSTNEIDTGKLWINGNAIYRKCYQITKSTTEVIIDTISNLSIVTRCNTYLTRNDGYKNIDNFYGGTSDKGTTYVDPNNNIKYNSSYNGTLDVVLEYTKTS